MDIIFFALLAFYVFFKLNKELGKIDEDQVKQMEEKLSKAGFFGGFGSRKSDDAKQQIIEIKNQIEETIPQNLDEDTKQNLLTILRSCNITTDFFLDGAKAAFEIVIKAFSNDDLASLKGLLSEKIYEGFESVINSRKEKNINLTTNIISIDQAEIFSAMMIGNIASVSVRFVSRQINYVADADGNVIEGKKDEIFQLTDVWTFKKDVTSNNPNWSIISTNHA